MNYFVSISGGLDSTALAIILHKEKKHKYIFSDTGDEFPAVYKHLEKMEKTLNINIIMVQNEKHKSLRNYEIQKKFFPGPGKRFCTYQFKIMPIEKYMKAYEPFKLAIGLRADENRKGNTAAYAYYPLQKVNIKRCDVLTMCKMYELIPDYPWYMSRGGCYSCYFKTNAEILGLAKYEPKLFDELIEREDIVQDKRSRRFEIFRRAKGSLRVYKRIAKEVEQTELLNMKITEGGGHNDCGLYCLK